MAGTACIVFQTGLSLEHFNGAVLFWGILSAVGIAVYSLEPIELLRKYGTATVVGFAMFISGIVAEVLFRSHRSEGYWDGMTWLAFFAVVFLGTIVSFNAYMGGIRIIGAVQGSILSSIEPISAALFGWALLGNRFTISGVIGMVLIILTIFIIAYEKERNSHRNHVNQR